MKLSAAYICDQGKVRMANQDNLYFCGKVLNLEHVKSHSHVCRKASTRSAVCFGVFDGMGGEQYGEVASYLAAETLKNQMKKNKAGKIPGNILLDACCMANKIIYKKTLELKAKRIGATAAIIYVQYDRIWCCNVGDSKIYRLRKGVISQISFDHIYREKNDSGRKPGLTQHLGMDLAEMTLEPYITDEVIEAEDKYLICSDGLTDMVPLKEIEEVMLQNFSPKKCSHNLMKRAMENGGRDNITIIVLILR